MLKRIIDELREHAPITALGALSGIVIMLLFKDMPRTVSEELFYVFHPLHILLSALATATMYRLHTCPQGKGKPCNPAALAFHRLYRIGGDRHLERLDHALYRRGAHEYALPPTPYRLHREVLAD